jgi:dienelactone hydrolase
VKGIKRLLLAYSICFFGAITGVAQTGHVMRTIATSDPLLNGDSLSIYFHVPDSYDSQVESKLIIGFHGLGDPNNSQQIRQYLTPVGDSINAIVMCPDPYLQDQPRSEAVLHIAYDSVMTWYNIDPSQVYITGYSAGSDVAARYVFGEPQYAMKGFIWHSPGFFFSPDLSDPQSIPPVCLCSGTQDFTSIVQTNLLNNNLNNSSTPYEYIAMPGVGHTMDYPAFVPTMLQCIGFIDAQYSTNVPEDPCHGIRLPANVVSAGEAIRVSGSGSVKELAVLDLSGRTVNSSLIDGLLVIRASPGHYIVRMESVQGAVTYSRVLLQ